MPLFALANAGVDFGGGVLGRLGSRSRGRCPGLLVGKTVGISAAIWLARRLLGTLPEGMRLRHIVGVGALGGIGFTVSMFIAGLAFDQQRLVDTRRSASSPRR